MVEQSTAVAPQQRLDTLMRFLESDPNNLTLLSDAAETALAADQPALAREFLDRYAARSPLPDKETGLAGLAAMRDGKFDAAVELFRAVLPANRSDASLRFNLAWSLAMLKDFRGALDLLDAGTVNDLPQAAMLCVQLLHDQGKFDDAISLAKQSIAHHPEHSGLLAAVSVLALDIEDVELARTCALRAGSQPDALVTLGTLALGNDQNGEALDLFSQALERNSQAARAWVGKGLAQLATGDHAAAVSNLQRGAELFDEHVGSWIAAGWAHLVSSNLPAAEKCFERALALDHNFSETHGSLAVLNLMTGRNDEGRRFAQTALRLDSKSFSGALAQALLLSSAGKTDFARGIVERALNTPIDSSGRTIAKVMARQTLHR